MLKETLTYTDYFGNEQTRDFYFHYSEAELTKMQLGQVGGLERFIEKILQTQDQPKLADLFEEFILASYGERSEDGQQFIKNEEVRNRFKQCPAYSDLFMRLMTDDEYLAYFIQNVVPQSIREKAAQVEKERGGDTLIFTQKPQIESKE